MAHTLISCHLRPLAYAEPFRFLKKGNKNIKQKNVFKFHLFTPFTFHLLSQTCSGVETEPEIQKKGNKHWDLEGFKG